MNNKLITALRLTAHRIEIGEYQYCWTNSCQCNCGLLARTILNISEAQLLDRILEDRIPWDKIAIPASELSPWGQRVYCYTSGLSRCLLIQALVDAGLEPQEVVMLEDLKDPKILLAVGRELTMDNPKDVCDYMRTWANLLLEDSEPERSKVVELAGDSCLALT